MRRTMLACIAICAALGGASGASAQFPDIPLKTIPAPAEPGALPLYPAGVPGGSAGAAAEHWNQMWDARAVRNVTRPTLTPVLPDRAKATGAAVIVAPGGAFLSLSMDSEGWGVAHWLADHGIAAFVLKYRLNPTPDDDKAFMAVMAERMGAAMKKGADHAPPIRDPEAADDAVAALRLVRARAGEWGVDPRRVGLIGFSPGAMTVLDATLRDAPDARPDFLGVIYGPMGAVKAPGKPPPLFAALAANDALFAHDDYSLLASWRGAGGDVEFHLYQGGDHGFGSRKLGTTSDLWPEEFLAWMRSEGLLQPNGKPVTGKMF